MAIQKAKFSIGDIVKHKHFEFRGVIYDVKHYMPSMDKKPAGYAVLPRSPSLSIEPIVAVQISGQKQLMTVKGSFGHFHEYCEEIPLYVKDTTEDLFRIGVHNAFEENMDVGKFLAKEKFQEDLKDTKIQHKLIGEKVWPVLFFQGRRGKTYIEYMNQLDACDAMLEFDVQLFPLEDQTADLQDYKKDED